MLKTSTVYWTYMLEYVGSIYLAMSIMFMSVELKNTSGNQYVPRMSTIGIGIFWPLVTVHYMTWKLRRSASSRE